MSFFSHLVPSCAFLLVSNYFSFFPCFFCVYGICSRRPTNLKRMSARIWIGLFESWNVFKVAFNLRLQVMSSWILKRDRKAGSQDCLGVLVGLEMLKKIIEIRSASIIACQNFPGVSKSLWKIEKSLSKYSFCKSFSQLNHQKFTLAVAADFSNIHIVFP